MQKRERQNIEEQEEDKMTNAIANKEWKFSVGKKNYLRDLYKS